MHRGSLEDLESLKSGAAKADGVSHCTFDHDFSNFAANCEKDKRNIEAMATCWLDRTGRLSLRRGLAWGPQCRANLLPKIKSILATRIPVSLRS